MLLQTNSYIVPNDKRAEHARQIRRFRQTLLRLGCDHFEVYEQVGPNWSNSESTGRYVQIMRFVDRKHQLAVQAAERNDPTAQAVIADFCELINFPYQQQQGLFAIGFYTSVLPIAPLRARNELADATEPPAAEDTEAAAAADDEPILPPQEPVSSNGEHQEAEPEPVAAADETPIESSANGEPVTAELEQEELTPRLSGNSENESSEEVAYQFLEVEEDQPVEPGELVEPIENIDSLTPLEHADRKEIND
jgi:hypothetical protein